MSEFGKTLKKLIDSSNVKMYLVAESVGYDVSYISKWCNKDYLPSARTAPRINDVLARLFAEDISSHDDFSKFREEFGFSAETQEDLEGEIRSLLQQAYDASQKKCVSTRNSHEESSRHIDARALVHTDEIRRFFRQDFSEYLRSENQSDSHPVEVLCTLDICLFLEKVLPMLQFPGDMDFHVRIAVCEDRLYRADSSLLAKLYTFMSMHSRISFDLYSYEKISSANMLTVEDRLAALFSLDADRNVISIFTVTSPEAVHHIQSKLLPLFNRSKVLLYASDPKDFHRKGYRTDFYSRDHFQILLACGFEYLLPRDCFATVEETARKQYNNEHFALLVRRLQVTWEEIFEHGHIDFFVLKTSILRYVETGEIIFTDVVCHLSPEQRKNHIQNILNVTRRNPNIVFYLLDDEKFTAKNPLAYLSVFNNRQKAFMKNPNRYHCDNGPYFYSISDNRIIEKMTDYLDTIKSSPICTRYGYPELQAFYDKYSSLINRMIDL